MSKKEYGAELIGKRVVSVCLSTSPEYKGVITKVVKGSFVGIDTLCFDKGGGLHRHYCAIEDNPSFNNDFNKERVKLGI